MMLLHHYLVSVENCIRKQAGGLHPGLSGNLTCRLKGIAHGAKTV